MATLLKYLDGTQETVSWSGIIYDSTLSVYYNTGLCAIIDYGNVTGLGGGEYIHAHHPCHMFQGFKNLKYVSFPGVTKIFCETFYDCSSLMSAEFDNVQIFETADGYAEGEEEPVHYAGGQFAYCTNLKYLRLPEIYDWDNCDPGGTYIIYNYYPFQGCSSLEYIDLRDKEDADHLKNFKSTGLPSDYDLIVDEAHIYSWKDYNPGYANHFDDQLRISHFKFHDGYVGNRTIDIETRYLTKEIVESLSDCHIVGFDIVDSNVSNCINQDAFQTNVISDMNELFYYSPHGLSAYWNGENPFDWAYYYFSNKVFNVHVTWICADTDYDLDEFVPCWHNDGSDPDVYVNLSIDYDESYEGEKNKHGMWYVYIPSLINVDARYNTCIDGILWGKNFLTSLNAPEVSAIGDNGLEGGNGGPRIQVLTLPKVKTVGKSAFYNNTSILSINLPLIESIGEGAFQCCCALRNVYAPQLTSLGISAFGEYNDNLECVTMPLLRNIGDYAFANCRQLTNIFAPDITTMNCYMAQNIGISAFYNCQNLTSINGRFVEYVGEGAFNGCSNITDMNFPLLSTFENSQQTLSGCDLEDIWIPQVSSQNVYIPSNSDRWMERFCNYSPDFTIDNIPSDPDMVQLRGYNVDILAGNSGLYWAGLSKDSCRVMGYEWAGDEWRYVKQGYTERTQYAPSPDPREGWKDWMHLCLDPEAAPWLSAVFLKNSNFREEYRWYITSGEFANANDKHDYLPKYCGSVYD